MGVIIKPFSQWRKAKCQRENPSNCQLPFLSHSPNHLILPEIGWVSYCMRMGKVWKLEIRIWGSTHFWEKRFWLLRQVNTQKCMPIWLSTHVLHFLTQWKLGSCFPSRFWLAVYVSFMLGDSRHFSHHNSSTLEISQAARSLLCLAFLFLGLMCVFSLTWVVIFFISLRFRNSFW